jgi:poly [ADP-ribose] polymerase
MTEIDGEIHVKYGRVGVTEQTARYPMSKWDSLLRSKIKKGYKDVTELRVVDEVGDFQQISNDVIAAIVGELQAYAKRSVQRNYTISSEAVTQKQVDEAQRLLDKLAGVASKKRIKYQEFDDILLELFQVIPRRMGNVADHLLKPRSGQARWWDDAPRMVATEQATLDVMKGQVSVNTAKKAKKDDIDHTTILDAMGLDIQTTSDNDIKTIRTELGGMKGQLGRSFQVINKRTQKRFNEFVKKSKNKKRKLFWHGSRNENWWSILNSGLVLRPTNAVITGKMFGYGLYFADRAKKSYGYTSCRGSYWARGSSDKGFMSLYDVHLGHSLVKKRHEGWMYDLTLKKLRDRGGYDSLTALGGADLRNNEFIIYDERQCTVKYLVEVS